MGKRESKITMVIIRTYAQKEEFLEESITMKKYYRGAKKPHNYVTYGNINLENEKEHKKFEGRAHYLPAYYDLLIIHSVLFPVSYPACWKRIKE